MLKKVLVHCILSRSLVSLYSLRAVIIINSGAKQTRNNKKIYRWRMHPRRWHDRWHGRLSSAINVLIPLFRHNRHWRCFTLWEQFNKRGIVQLTVTRPLKNFDYFALGVVGALWQKTAIIDISRRPPCRIALHVKIGHISHWRRRALKWFMLSSRFILLLLSRALPRVHGISGIY